MYVFNYWNNKSMCITFNIAATSATSASTAVLANALSQYDANGQLVSAAPITQVASTTATAATSQLMGQTSSTQTTVTKNGGNSN